MDHNSSLFAVSLDQRTTIKDWH